MKKIQRARILRCSAVGLALLSASSWLSAHPYASGVTNNSGTIQFTLNETADTVKVAFDNNTVTNVLGTNVAAGVQSFSLGSHTNYSIIVSKAGSGVISEISSDTNVFVNFVSPRGVAVNNNAKDANFGRIYVSNAGTGSVAAGAHNAARASMTRGIYALNADLSDALGQGNTAKTAGLPFVSSSYSPWKMYVGPDGNVYIANTSTVSGGGFLAVADPALATGSLVLTGAYASYAAGQNHSQIMGTPVVQGSLAAGNLVVSAMDVNYPPGQSIQQWNIGADALPSSVSPTTLASSGEGAIFNVGDSFITTSNSYILLNRSSPTNPIYPCVQVFDTSGNRLWDSFNSSRISGFDLFAGDLGMTISPDGQLIATVRSDSANIISYLTNGIPDESTLFTNIPPSTAGSSYASVFFDAAENLYTVTSGTSLLRVYSLGLTTTAITSNDATGTNGTFQLLTPSTSVGVIASTPDASQNYGTPIPGVFTITRTGSLNASLTVNFTVSGTATNGTYTISATNSVTIPAGQSSVTVTVTPVSDNVSRPQTTVVLTLQNGGSSYTTLLPGYDTIKIQNTGPQQLMAVANSGSSMYRGLTNDYATFTIIRTGDTNPSSGSYIVTNFTYAGTAVQGTDYLGTVLPVTINPGDVSVTAIISNPVPNTVYTGNETILIGIGPDSNYTLTTNQAAITLVDNLNPPATVLYSNALTDPNDATNWNTTYGNANMANVASDDYEVDFGYDITYNNPASGNNGAVPPPPSGATNVLRITVNKKYTPGASAGVNVYPIGLNFSGNYAVRFDMNLVQSANTGAATEGVLLGINHNGTETNWWVGDNLVTPGTWPSDGVWYWIDGDGGGAANGDYIEFTGNGGSLPNTGWAFLKSGVFGSTSFADVFKHPAPYTSTGGTGVPSNYSPLVGDASSWSQVEIKQYNGVVTLSINKSPVFVYTNTTTFTNGTLMLGYDDPFASVGLPDGAAYFSNIKVVRLGPPSVTGIVVSGGNVSLTFATTDAEDSTASFALQSASNLTGPYTDVTGATITQSGAFHVTVPVNGAAQFYRIRHK